jgi:hypothetical protein
VSPVPIDDMRRFYSTLYCSDTRLKLGNIPPPIVPFLISRAISDRVRLWKTSFLSASITPSTSVKLINLDAWSAIAISPAAMSALMLRLPPDLSIAIGAMTGI